MANLTNRTSATGETQKRGASRQPFVGLAMMAALGIIAADVFPVPQAAWLSVAAAFLAAGLAVLRWPTARSTYALVSLGFFLLHSSRIEDTPGLRLAAQLGDRRSRRQLGGWRRFGRLDDSGSRCRCLAAPEPYRLLAELPGPGAYFRSGHSCLHLRCFEVADRSGEASTGNAAAAWPASARIAL